jgi:hypothetical protein
VHTVLDLEAGGTVCAGSEGAPGRFGDEQIVEQHLGRERLIELVLAITYYNHVVRVAAVLKLEIDEHVKLPMDKYPPPARIGV